MMRGCSGRQDFVFLLRYAMIIPILTKLIKPFLNERGPEPVE